MSENKTAKTPADGPEYERGFVEGMQRQMQLHVNRVIKTWIERCEEHPDHQTGMISEGMIRARMQEEIDALRQALETEQEPVAWMNVNEDGECEQIEYGPVFDDPGVTPLYTAPPQREWVGLTDQEINSVCYKRDWTAPWTNTTFARAIEQALKEKNYG